VGAAVAVVVTPAAAAVPGAAAAREADREAGAVAEAVVVAVAARVDLVAAAAPAAAVDPGVAVELAEVAEAPEVVHHLLPGLLVPSRIPRRPISSAAYFDVLVARYSVLGSRVSFRLLTISTKSFQSSIDHKTKSY
jgi:hypothetical protein